MTERKNMSRAAKNVVVAGAAGHLGTVLVSHLISRKIQVVALVRDQAEKNRLSSVLQRKGYEPTDIITGDHADKEAVANLIRQAMESLGVIDALVNVAGAFRYKLLEDSVEDDYTSLFDSNFK